MGVPIKSIKSFEEDIRSHSRKEMVLIILANARSDSRAVELVMRNFHVMDTISDDVDFYLPGYLVHTNNIFDERYHRYDFDESWYREMEENEFADSHYSAIHTEFIDSPRLGRILFNDIEFADFVMEFTKRKHNYAYLGGCQMILMPINSDRTPNYDAAETYELEKFVDPFCSLSLDTFLHNTFEIIRKEGYGNNSIMNRFLRRQHSVINQISEMYNHAILRRSDNYEIVVRNVIYDMQKCLHWDIELEDYFFISYSSRDIMKATMLKNTLQDNGRYVWMAPDGIPQGREYGLVIPMALRFAKYFVLLLSRDSAQSRWVKRELDIAINNEPETKIKVILIDGYTCDDLRSDAEIAFYLNRIQIKYTLNDILTDSQAFKRFLNERF